MPASNDGNVDNSAGVSQVQSPQIDPAADRHISTVSFEKFPKLISLNEYSLQCFLFAFRFQTTIIRDFESFAYVSIDCAVIAVDPTFTSCVTVLFLMQMRLLILASDEVGV